MPNTICDTLAYPRMFASGCERYAVTKLPQHLRAALANGQCRIQPTAHDPGPTHMQDPPEPEPLVTREEQLIDQLLARLAKTCPQYTRSQLTIQALQAYINSNPPPSPVLQPTEVVTGIPTTDATIIDAGLPASVVVEDGAD